MLTPVAENAEPRTSDSRQERLLRYDASRVVPAIVSKQAVEQMAEWSGPVSVRIEVGDNGVAEFWFKKLDVVEAF